MSRKRTTFSIFDVARFSALAAKSELTRKHSVFSFRFLFCSVFALALSLSVFSVKEVSAQNPKTVTANSVANLNTILANPAGYNPAVEANDTIQFYKNVPGTPGNIFISVDNIPITGGGTTPAYSLNVYKTGNGLWRLGGANNTNGTNNNFTVSAGTLELMKNGSINVQGATTAVFTLNANTVLNVRGQDAGAGGTTITAKAITLNSNTTLGIDLSNYNTGSPALTLAGPLAVNGTGQQLNLLGFRNEPSNQTVQLLTYNYTGAAAVAPETFSPPPLRFLNESKAGPPDAAYAPNAVLTVRGEAWNDVVAASDGRLQGTLIQETAGANNANTSIVSLTNFISKTGTVTWGGGDGLWNATSKNWTGMGSVTGSTPHTFLHGDKVVFGVVGAGTIDVQQGGVQIGAGGMEVNGGNYTFTNNNNSIIGIDGPGGLHVFSQDPTDTLNPTTVTFEGPNSFWGGTVIDTNGHVILKHSAGLGSGTDETGTGIGTVQLNGGWLIFDTDAVTGNDNFYNNITGLNGGKLIKLGMNTVTLNGGNSSNADTTVKFGTLQNNIGTGVLTVYEGATYNAMNKNRTVAGIRDYDYEYDINNPPPTPLIGGTVDMGIKQGNNDLILTINVAALSSTYEFSGQIKGNGAEVAKYGKGTQIFSNNFEGSGYENTYSGGTKVFEGKLVAKESLPYDSSVVGAENRFNITPFGTGDIAVYKPGYGNDEVALVFDISHGVVAPDTAPVPPVNVARVDNKLRGNGKVIKTGDAILSLTGDASGTIQDNVYRGEVDVQQGYLRVEHNNALGKAEKIILYGDYDNPNGYGKTVLQLSKPDAPGTAISDPTALTGNSRDNPFDRVITGKGDIEILENTIVYLKGSNDSDKNDLPDAVIGNSDYTGQTRIYGGAELIIRNAAGTGNTSAVIMIKGDSAPLPSPSTFTLDFSEEDDGENGQKYNRYITGPGNLQKTGTGTAYLVKERPESPNNDYTGRTLIKEGVLKIAYAGATGVNDSNSIPEQKVEISAGAKLELAFDIDEVYQKGIKGAGALAKSGTTTATLGGVSTYSGGTYIYGGTLSYTNAAPSNPGNIGTGGVYFQRGGGTLQNRMDVDDLNQNVWIDSGSTAVFETAGTLTNSQGIYNRELPAGGKSSIVKTGNADMYINGDAEWTGPTTVKNGWLYNNVPETTDLYVYTGAGYNTGAGTLVMGGQRERTVASIHGEDDTRGGTITVVNGTNLVVKYRDNSPGTAQTEDVFAGNINGDGGLVLDAGESAAGKNSVLRLTGGNTYSGGTTIRGKNGTLIGNIALNTALEIGSTNTYVSGGKDRQISALTGYGNVDMQNKNLTIFQNNISKEPVFNGRITGVLNLYKTGNGSQQLSGSLLAVNNNVEVRGGKLILGGASYPSAVNIGNDLIVNGKLPDGTTPVLSVGSKTQINAGNNLNIQGQLDFTPNNSLIEAGHSVTLGKDSVLNITGIGENDRELIIRSKGETIEDNFGTVIIAGSSEPEQDFLYLGVEKSENKKEIWVGQTLRWYSDSDAHGTFTLNGSSSYYNIGRELHDVSGTFAPAVWDGKTLTKKGEGTLELSRENTYTGKSIVEDGTLKLTHEKATGGSSEIVLADASGTHGGTLEINFDSRDRSGNWTSGLATAISGLGDVKKTGSGYAVLSGDNTYTGRTNVLQGALLVDGSIASDVYVAGGAGFGGNGRTGGSVLLEDNSYYLWRFGASEYDSDTMTVSGRLSIGQGVFFKPLTTLMSQDEVVNADGWTVIRYGELIHKFAGVDSSSNPFYNFELDYDTFGAIKIHGTRLDQPRALSDAVATSAAMAQTKMWRSVFRQIQREWACDCPPAVRQIQIQNDIDSGYSKTRGQSPATYRTAWMNFVGRGDKFDSTYFNNPYSFQSYGFQTGVSLYSTCDRSFGLMFGREEGQLKNNSDKVENEDYYLGLYFARMFQRNFDFLAYVGGGWQKNNFDRFSNERAYAAAFHGNTFNFDFEIGKRFYTQRGSFLRPYFGFDVEIAHLGGAKERTMDGYASNEIRNYGITKLDQVFFKVGVDVSRSWRMLDLNGGVNLNWNIADDYARSTIYYPFIDKSIDSTSAGFGRFNCALNIGLNWYLTQRRNSAFYIDYQAEIHQDRSNNFASGTGVTGFFWRF